MIIVSRNLVLFLLSFGSLLCNGQDTVSHSLFFIGDCGEPYVEGDPIADVFRREVAHVTTAKTVLFLGDNVYPKGLPFKGERLRREGEAALQHQVDMVPGQQEWIDSLHDRRIQISPRNGCPGPVEIPLDHQNILVILDTQWLLHKWKKPGEDSDCASRSLTEVMDRLKEIFARNQGKRIVIAAHHPLITYGEHGGVFTWKAHIFPLEELTDHLYLPLPLIGSIYPLYRRWLGHNQDTAHPLYKKISRSIRKLMAENPGTVYVAGHEHALEYIIRDSSHFVVSGSGSKVEYVKKKGDAQFASAVRGFVRADLRMDGSLSLYFIHVDNRYPAGRVVFEKLIAPVKSK
jgi:hypothetical protein